MEKHGSCLCGTVKFSVTGKIKGVGQCHCSQCRKVSGTNGNAIFLVPVADFTWVSGESHQVEYELKPTWGTTRCKTCGSPLPKSIDGRQVWVPAGLMDDPLETAIGMHIFCASRADWDRPSASPLEFPEFPSEDVASQVYESKWFDK